MINSVKNPLAFIVLFLVAALSFGQTTYYFENFSSNDGKGAFGPNNTYDTVGVGDAWTIDVSACTLADAGDYFKIKYKGFKGRDLDGEAIWMSKTVDISGSASANLTVDFKAGNQNTQDPSWYLRFFYKINGGTEIPFSVNGNNGWTDQAGNWAVAEQTNVIGNTVQIVIRAYNTNGSATWSFDNVKIEGVATGTLADVQNQGVTNECLNSMDITWTDPIGFIPTSSDILVFAKLGSAVTLGTPTLNTSTYTADNNFAGTGTPYENDAAAKCVYKGDANSFTVTGLSAASTYHFLIFNAGGTVYSSGKTTSSTTITNAQNVSGFVVVTGNNAAVLNWGAPATCHDEFLIVARANNPVMSGTPTGDGSTYTASPVFGNGTSLLGGSVVYKANGINTSVLNLATGTTYFFKIFTRVGTTWSSGVEVSGTPENLPNVGDVLITEVSRSSTLNGASYIEIYNTTNADISLGGSKLARYASDGITLEKVFDFSFEGSGQNIVPANGFLILGKNATQAAFEAAWGITLGSLPDPVNYNNTANLILSSTRIYELLLGGTINVNDGTQLDKTEEIVVSAGRIIYQCPIGSWLGNTDLQAAATPGYFGFQDNIHTWQLAAYNGAWANGVAPSASSGSDNALIKGGTTLIPNGGMVADMYIQEAAAVSLDNNNATVNGNLTIEEDGSVLITGTGNLATAGTTTIFRTGENSELLYNVWSSPFVNNLALLSTFAGTNPCDLYCFMASNQTWKYDFAVPFNTTCLGNPVTFTTNHVIPAPEGNPDGFFDIGRGYFITGSSTNPTRSLVSTGQLNNGNISVPIYGSSVVIPPSAGGNDWNIIGNPYPSGIVIGDLVTANPLINAVYVYRGFDGSFVTYGQNSGLVVGSCQGFYIDANTTQDGVIGNLNFTNSMRESVGNVFRSASTSQSINLSLTKNNDLSDPTNILFSADSEDGKDRVFDARKLPNPNGMNLASVIVDENYAINGLKTFTEGEKTIPLFVETNGEGAYVIALDSITNLPGIEVFLEDRENGNEYNLSEVSFSFQSSNSTVYADRFYLRVAYPDGVTGIEDIAANENNYQVYTEANTLKIVSKNSSINRVEVYDLLGKLIHTSQPNSRQAQMNTGSFMSGVYLVKISDESGAVNTVKVSIIK